MWRLANAKDKPPNLLALNVVNSVAHICVMLQHPTTLKQLFVTTEAAMVTIVTVDVTFVTATCNV